MGARPYDTALGRFLTVDPIDGGSLNTYDYAAQDPVNGFDLNGMAVTPIHIGILAAVVFAAGGGICVSSPICLGKKIKIPRFDQSSPPSNAEAREQAQQLGYSETNDYPFDSHGQLVFRKGGEYISPDWDQHRGRGWKVFDRRGRRIATKDWNLDNRLGD